MDSNHDKKRMNEEDDRLSRLPDELIHKILSFMGIKQAIQTSLLASRWRFIWTSMPYLNFSTDDFSRLCNVSEFVTHVLSDRNNQTEVSSVKISFQGKDTNGFVQHITKYAVSHSIQQLNLECLPVNEVEVSTFLFSSQSLKHLTFTKENFSGPDMRRSFSYVIKTTSTWEFPALTTLYLHGVTLCCDGNTDKCVDFFSKCANLKNLTLKDCYTKGFKGLSICLPLLCSLTLKDVYGSVDVFNMVAPELKNLNIECFPMDDCQYLISAPDLTFLLYKAYDCWQLSSNDFLCLEKADINVHYPCSAHQALHLLQQLHNVKSLTLNLELVELLSENKYVELMSHQPSPFANLKSLKIHPGRDVLKMRGDERVEISSEVKSYLLGSSSGVTFTIVSPEEFRAMKNTKLAQNLITELQELLEEEKASTKSKVAKMLTQQKTQVDKNIVSYMNRYCKWLTSQIEKQKEKASEIIINLEDIKGVLGKLPASNMAIIQPSFSALCAEVDSVMNKNSDFMKMSYDEYQRCLSVCVNGLATTLEPSS